MASLRYSGGQSFNFFSRGTTTISSGTADPNYPLANLYGNRPVAPLRFTAAGTTKQIDCDLDLCVSAGYHTGTMETDAGGLPSGWTDISTGGSSMSRTTVAGEFASGAAGMKCDRSGGSGNAIGRTTFVARAGETLTISFWSKLSSASTCFARIRNTITGNYYVSGAWQAAAGSATTATSTTGVVTTLTFAVESMATCGQELCTMRFELGLSSTAIAYFDDAAVWPAVDFISLHGHNLGASFTVNLQSSADGATYASETLQAPSSGTALVLAYPSCHGIIASPVTTKRYWRVLLTDGMSTAGGIPYIGQAVLGATITPTSQPRHYAIDATGINYRYPQLRVPIPLGGERVQRLSAWANRVMKIAFLHKTEAAWADWRENFRRRMESGGWPGVVIPRDDESPALFGRAVGSWDSDREHEGPASLMARAETLEWVELPFPIVGASGS